MPGRGDFHRAANRPGRRFDIGQRNRKKGVHTVPCRFASVANPKFASAWAISRRISDSRPHEQFIESRVVFEFEVPKRECHENRRNFKSTTRVENWTLGSRRASLGSVRRGALITSG
jgi:hypothetical protein